MRRGTLIVIVGLFVLLAVAAFAQYRIGQRDVRIPVTVPGTPRRLGAADDRRALTTGHAGAALRAGRRAATVRFR